MQVHDTTCDPATWWRDRASQTARFINLAWWLEVMTAPTLIGSTAASAAILLWRIHGGGGVPTSWIAILIFLSCSLAAACFLIAKRKFESPAQSLVRLETALDLHNALSAAEAGIAPWPQPCKAHTTRHAGLRLQWRRVAMPPVIACTSLSAAFLIPIADSVAAASTQPRQPLAWTHLNAELDALMDAAVVEENHLQETRDRIAQLRTRDPGEWYSHNTMEATDTIAQAHRTEANRIDDALARARYAIERMQHANPGDRHRQFEDYQKAVADMANGTMQPNETLRQQLDQIGAENLNQLTPEQFEKLRNQLRAAHDALRNARQQGEGDAADPHGNNAPPPMPGARPSDDGEHAADILGNLPDGEREAGEFTPLAAHDLSLAALGDLLELQTSTHEVTDPNSTTQKHGGTTEATGRGGDRVWRDTLDPGEQRTLRKFFE